MSYLVFDIETIGKPFDEFDDTSKDIFREWAQRDTKNGNEAERELEQIKQGLPLSPFLGEIVAISVLDGENKGGTYFQAPEEKTEDFEENGLQYRVGDEREILERFWDIARHYTTFVTFNGRGFDVPYLMIRAAVHGIRPSRDLLSNRYLSMQRGVAHVDLSDQLTFYGAMWRKPKLHFATQAFGIESPKTGDIDGAHVPQAFKEKRYTEIARYCMADVVATKELYERWNEYLNFQG
jgi:3'-5' exonuclease